MGQGEEAGGERNRVMRNLEGLPSGKWQEEDMKSTTRNGKKLLCVKVNSNREERGQEITWELPYSEQQDLLTNDSIYRDSLQSNSLQQYDVSHAVLGLLQLQKKETSFEWRDEKGKSASSIFGLKL